MSVGAVNKQTGDRIPTAGMPAIDDALDLTSVNPVQNAIITAALADKQDKTDNSLQTTDKTVVGAINEHEGDISSLKSGLTNYEATTNAALAVPENTGKNVLPYTLSTIKQNNSSGTWVDNVVTINGVAYTITANGDKVTKISATRISASEINAILELGDYAAKTGDILSGCPIGGSNTTYKVYCRGGSTGDFGEGATIAAGDVGVSRRYAVAVFSTSSPTNLEFYPMIRPAIITDPTFAPYIPSVESRIEAVENGKVNKLTRISNNVPVTDTSATQTINSLDGCNMLLFVAKISSSVRNTLLIPYSLFKSGVDVYIPIAKQTTVGSLYVKYNSDTSITLFTTISDYNYLDIYGDK